MPRDFEYESHNVGYDHQYPEEVGGGIKCKNYEVCNTILPTWWYDCKESYVCSNCDIFEWGVLEVMDHSDCTICLDTKRCVRQPKCIHPICIGCIRRCYYGEEENAENAPPEFPYSKEIKDLYDKDYDSDDPKWDEYPLIPMWSRFYSRWIDEREEKYIEEEYLRRCPLCRK